VLAITFVIITLRIYRGGQRCVVYKFGRGRVWFYGPRNHFQKVEVYEDTGSLLAMARNQFLKLNVRHKMTLL